MLAGAALQAGIQFQTQAAGRRGIVTPGGDYEESFADQERRPGVVGMLDPVDVGAGDGVAELGRGFAGFEKSLQPAVMFDYAFGAGFIEIG